MGIVSTAFCFSLFLAFSSAGKLLEFSYTREVEEGELAHFCCVTKLGKAVARWKIGDYTDEEGNGVKSLRNHGLAVEHYNNHELEKKYKDKGHTTCIKIMATAELDRAPVQCVVIPHNTESPIEYSKFIILTVHPNLDGASGNYNTSEGTSYQDVPRSRNSRSVSSPMSSGAAFSTTNTNITFLLLTILTLHIL